MKNSDIIKLVREPIISFFNKYKQQSVEKKIYPSAVISLVLLLYNDGSITDQDIYNNNIFGLPDPGTGENLKFSTVEECMLAIMSVLDPEGKLLSYDQDKIKNMAKANNLYRFDKDFLNNAAENIIDLDDEQCIPQVDQYTVKEDNTVLLKTDNLDAAKDAQKEAPKSKIYNSQGNIITVQQSNYTPQVKSSLIAAGSLINCKNVNLYYKETDARPGRVINGVYKLYDGVKRRDRYAIAMKNANFILGYINSNVLE